MFEHTYETQAAHTSSYGKMLFLSFVWVPIDPVDVKLCSVHEISGVCGFVSMPS